MLRRAATLRVGRMYLRRNVSAFERGNNLRDRVAALISSTQHLCYTGGMKRYFGKVCARHPGHGGERYLTNHGCVGCDSDRHVRPDQREKANARRRTRRWLGYEAEHERRRRLVGYRLSPEVKAARAAERKALAAAVRAEKSAAKEAARAARDAERAATRDQRRREARRREREKYAATYPEKVSLAKKVSRARRRAAEKQAAVELSPEEKKKVSALYAEARRLTKETGYQWSVHHVIPLSKGGPHHPDNLEVIAESMNNAIGDTPMKGWDYLMS